MKRKASDGKESSHDHPPKRARMESASSQPLDQPEIFGKIISYLISRPINIINLAMASKRMHYNLYDAVSWNSAELKFLVSNNGRIDKSALTVTLQKLDYERLLAKNINIQQKLKNYDYIRYKRKPAASPFGLSSAESESFKQLSNAMETTLGLSRSLPVDFYEQALTNKILSESVIKSIANMIEEDYKLVPDIFRAFNYVLGYSREQVVKEAQLNVGSHKPVTCYRGISNYGSAFPLLQPGDDTPVEGEPVDPRAFLKDNSFLVCRAEDYDRNYVYYEGLILTVSCFFKYICDYKKAVVFYTQFFKNDDAEVSYSSAYWKVNLELKTVEESGSLRKLAMAQHQDQRLGNYSRLKKALLELFEIKPTDEVLQNSDASDFLFSFSVKDVVRTLEDNKL